MERVRLPYVAVPYVPNFGQGVPVPSPPFQLGVAGTLGATGGEGRITGLGGVTEVEGNHVVVETTIVEVRH